jgi:branched-chain amino acid transport system ATP-binding protein
MTTFNVENLSGGYGKLCVFRDASLSIASREVLGIHGPNGAGKTTLLCTIAGLLPAMSGRVLLGARDLTRMPAYMRARQGVALVPEGRQILATLSVGDNLDLARAAINASAGAAAFEERLIEAYELFPRLKERKAQPAGSLSGGEQQMLAIARALLIKPEVLILDEPTQGLAPVVVKSLGETLAKLKGRFSMIVVEQNREFLAELADRSMTMRAGSLLADTTHLSDFTHIHHPAAETMQ